MFNLCVLSPGIPYPCVYTRVHYSIENTYRMCKFPYVYNMTVAVLYASQVPELNAIVLDVWLPDHKVADHKGHQVGRHPHRVLKQ